MPTSQQQHLYLLRLALEQHLLSQDQVKEVLSLQQRYQQQGYDFSLLHIAVKKGYLDEAQLHALQNRNQTRVRPANHDSNTQRRTLVDMARLTTETVAMSGAVPTADWDPENKQAQPTQVLPLRLDLPDSAPTDFALPGQSQLKATASQFPATQAQPPVMPKRSIDLETSKRPSIDQKIAETLRRYDSEENEHPQSFGRYQIVQELGRGNVGRVFLVKDPHLNRLVALKVLLNARMSDRTSIERFLREAQATAKLDHPHIVRVYDIGREEEIFYFTMDYLQGKSLEQLLKKQKKLSPRKAALMMHKICLAMDYAHSQEIIHRDLKPANIMLDVNQEPRIMDFGMARIITDESARLSKSGTIIGTPAYMPPEQAHGDIRNIDKRSDVYSLGATLYEMITGRLPFPGTDAMKVLMKVVSQPPLPPRELHPQIPHDLQNICLKALQKDKSDRYASAKAMAEDLDRFLEGIAVEAESPAFSFKKWAQQHKGLLIGGASLVLIIVALVVWLGVTAMDLARQKEKLTSANKKLARQKKELDKQRLKAENNETLAHQEAKRLTEETKRLEISLKLTNWTHAFGQGMLPEELSTEDNLEKAFQKAKKFLANDSNFYLVWAKAYMMYLSKCDYTKQKYKEICAKVKDHLDKSLELDPKNFNAAFFGYQISYFQLNPKGVRGRFRDHIFKYISPAGDNCSSYFFRALQLKENKKYKQSLIYLDKAIKLNPQFVNAYIEKGLVYYEQHQYDLAEEAYEKARMINPNAPYADVEIAHLYLKKAVDSNAEKALTYLKKSEYYYDLAIKKNRFFGMFYIGKARLYETWGDIYLQSRAKYFEKALFCYNKAFELGVPGRQYIYYGWYRNLCFKMKKYDQALLLCQKMLPLLPKDDQFDFYRKRANIYQALNKDKESLEDYRLAYQLAKGYKKKLYFIQIKKLEEKIKRKSSQK